MKTLTIRSLRTVVLAAALMGTASTVFGQTVFTEDFNDEDISDWTPGSENLDNPDDILTPPSAAGGAVTLQVHASCFTDPFSGLGSTLTKTISLPNGNYILSYDVSHSTTFYAFCETAALGESGILVNGQPISPVSCAVVGDCGTCTVPSGTVTGCFTVTDGMAELTLRTFATDCGEATGVFDNITITITQGNCPNPSIDLTDLDVTCSDDPCVQTGSFDIINVSNDPTTVTVESITGGILFIGQRGLRIECEATTIQTVPAFPFSVGPGQTQTVTYTLTCTECPPEASQAHEIKNFVDVRLFGRDKDFHTSGSCFPSGE